MATDVDILVSQRQTKTKQYEAGLTPQKQISQKEVPQSASQCDAPCPLCQKEGNSGNCMLHVGHTQQHQCNRVSSHQWSGSGGPEVPGPH